MKKILIFLPLLLTLAGCGDKPEQKAPASAAPVAKPAPAPAPAPVSSAAVQTAPSGQTLYQRCAACHGIQGQTPALGKGSAIAGWSAAKTETALKAYRAGERNAYGMGNMMKSQAQSLTDAEIAALAAHIQGL